MADAIVRAQALGWVDDAFPGWIKVAVIDAAGQSHLIVDKVPVLTTLDVRPDSEFPIELWIDVDTVAVDRGLVTVKLKWG